MGDDPFFYLRDLKLLATWQVHVVTVSLMALLGLWIGVSRRPWYLGASAFLGLLLLFIPIAAPEPALLLLIGVSSLALTARLLRGWIATQHPGARGEERPAGRRWRFGIRDLLSSMVVVGLLTLLLSQLFAMHRRMNWDDATIGIVCFLALSLGTVAVRYQPGWKRQIVAVICLLALILTSVGVHLRFVSDWWYIADFFNSFVAMIFGNYHWFRPNVAVFYLLSFLEFVVILLIGCASLLPNKGTDATTIRRSLRWASTAMLATFAALLSVVYLHMLHVPPTPQENWPAQNDYPKFRATLAECRAINPASLSLAEVRTQFGPEQAARLAELYASLDQILLRDSVILFDSRNPGTAADWLDELEPCSHARGVVRAWHADAEAAAKAGQFSQAVQYDLRSLRMGALLKKRGVYFHWLVGVALEGIALHHLAAIREEVGVDEIREIRACMTRIDRSREPLELMIAREAVFDHNARAWRVRLTHAVERIFGIPTEDDPAVLAPIVCNRTNCHFELLRTELALREYRQGHGRWPDSLARLAPDHLPSLPRDPFSGQPLIYRLEGARFLLYSVGPDGGDNGGVFGPPPWFERDESAARDVDLDTWQREP